MPSVSRRQFLQTASLTAAATIANAQSPAPLIVDTHLHCFAGNNDPRFPYHPRGPYQPAAKASPEQLLSCMDGAGVNYAIVVHPEPYQDDHRYLEHCLDVGKGRVKGVCLVFADQPNSMAQLPALAKRGDVVAVRVHAYAPDRLPPFGKPELRAFWKKASDLGLMVQVHLEPRYAPGFEPYIREFAATKVIVDHLGRPFQGTPAEHAVIVRWSRFPNVVMKIAALPAPSEYPHRDIAPVIKQLTDAYGADRLIYGGGFGANATPASYRAAREKVQSYLSHLSPADQAKILGITAGKLFGFAR
ncbi:MAG: amidohydrolase [Blastocatellia bacterium]|nr:amidohydrolase [Blastocatellia bacterium]